jgi:hypothetical protein
MSYRRWYAQSRQSAKLFLQSTDLELPPRWRVCPPTLWSGREGTLACGRGVGGVPIPTRGHTLWCSMYISNLCRYVIILYYWMFLNLMLRTFYPGYGRESYVGFFYCEYSMWLPFKCLMTTFGYGQLLLIPPVRHLLYSTLIPMDIKSRPGKKIWWN